MELLDAFQEETRRLGFSMALDTGICYRQKSTQAQSSLNRWDRKKNLQEAFALRGAIQVTQAQYLPDLHLAIVDDVMTTGATVQALAKTLKQAGVRQVDVWCIARA